MANPLDMFVDFKEEEAANYEEDMTDMIPEDGNEEISDK